MTAKLAFSGTPGEVYEQHMVPAIFARRAPDLVEQAGVRPGDRVLVADDGWATPAASHMITAVA